MCKLNHSQQVNKIHYLSRKLDNIVGFKIATSSINKSSYIWLLRCLMKNCFDAKDDCDVKLVHLHLDTYNSEELKEIWKRIADGLALSYPSEISVEKIIKEICKKLRTEQDIILLFHRVDERNKRYLEQILNIFWNPLIAEVKKSKIEYRLFMCWIDYETPADWRETIQFVDDYQNIVRGSILNLYVTNKFEKDDLKAWVKSLDILLIISELTQSNLIEKENITQITEQIWSESQKGKPTPLLQAIYKICNLPWEEHKSKWERLSLNTNLN